MSAVSEALRGPWVAVIADNFGYVLDSPADVEENDEADVAVVRGTAAPVDGRHVSAVDLEPRAVLELLATKVEQYLTSGRQEDLLRIEMAEAVTEAWMVLRPNEPPPWRFDVPPVPDHVMAMTGPGDGGPRVWVRGQRRRWAEWPLTDEPDEWISFVEVIYRTGYGGLVECPDPRAAS